MKQFSISPVPPPQCPRIVIQKPPRRPARAAAPRSEIRRARVCPPMQLVHPEVIACLTQKIPNQPSPTVRNESEKSFLARIPRILSPLAPLDTREPPPTSVFGSTSPNSRVGRTCDDGGMPRSVTPCKAAVVPPLLLSASCVERVTKVPLTIVVPLESVDPIQRIVVSACGSPFPAEIKDGLGTAFNYAEIHRKAALVADFSDDSPVCSFGARLVAKPVRVRVPSSPLVDTESGASKVIAEAGGSKSHSEDITLVSAGVGTAPTLEWTSAIQEAMKDRPGLPPLSPVPTPQKPRVPITLEPASLALSKPSAAVVTQKEAPRLKAWIISSAKHALRDFTAKSKQGYSAPAEPPPTIVRRALDPICCLQYATGGSSLQQSLSASFRSCQWSRNPWYQVGGLGEPSEAPVWRDRSTDLETPYAARLSPEKPVWRDSEEESEEFVERKASPIRRAVWKAKERLQLTAPQMRLQPVRPPPLGCVSPLGARLRRNQEPSSGLGMANGKDNRPPPPSDDVRRSAKLALSRGGKPEVDWAGLGKPSSVVLDPARVSVITTDACAGGLGHRNITKGCGVTFRNKSCKGATREVVSDVVPFPPPPSTPGRTRQPVQIRRKTPRRQRCQRPVNSRQGKMPVSERQYGRRYREKNVLPSAKRSARQPVAPPSDAPAFHGGNSSGKRNVPSLVGIRDAGPGRIVSNIVKRKKKQMRAPAFGP